MPDLGRSGNIIVLVGIAYYFSLRAAGSGVELEVCYWTIELHPAPMVSRNYSLTSLVSFMKIMQLQFFLTYELAAMIVLPRFYSEYFNISLLWFFRRRICVHIWFA